MMTIVAVGSTRGCHTFEQDTFFVADNNGHAIRRVAGGIMSTYAGQLGLSGFSGDGGQATSARLSNPRGVGVDASGNLYIAGGSPEEFAFHLL